MLEGAHRSMFPTAALLQEGFCSQRRRSILRYCSLSIERANENSSSLDGCSAGTSLQEVELENLENTGVKVQIKPSPVHKPTRPDYVRHQSHGLH